MQVLVASSRRRVLSLGLPMSWSILSSARGEIHRDFTQDLADHGTERVLECPDFIGP
jgi:hypothetical protein